MARLLGASCGRGLLHQVHDPEDVVRARLGLHDSVVRRLFGRHFFHGDHATGALGIEDVGHPADGTRDGVQAQDGIAQGHQERLFAGEVFGAENGIAQAALQSLAGVKEIGLERLEFQFAQQVLLVGLGQRLEEFGIVVEVVFDGRFAAAGDEQDLFDTVRNQLFHDILHDRLARDRQHFLGLRLGGRQQTGPQTRHGNDSALNHHLNIPTGENAGMLYWAKKKRMEDIQQQLAALRQRIARVDRKYANAPPAPPPPERPDGQFIEELISGEVVTTALGQHFETERVWERHRRHGSVYISDLAELPEDLLRPAFGRRGGERASHAVGVSRYRDHRTRRRHRDVRVSDRRGLDRFRAASGCASFSCAITARKRRYCYRLAEYLAQFDVLVTYNGKAYDQPLLETRFRMVARAASLRPHAASRSAFRRAAPVETAPGKLPAGGSGESHSRGGAAGRSARRDDSLCATSIFCAARRRSRWCRSSTTTRSIFCRWPA